MFKFKKIVLLIVFKVAVSSLKAQYITVSPRIRIVTVESTNNQFELISTPFDNIEQSQIGSTVIRNKKSQDTIYKIDRFFDFRLREYYTIISDDGRTVIAIHENTERYKSEIHQIVEIYEMGMLKYSFSFLDILGCDELEKKCSLFYNDPIDSVKWIDNNYEVFYKSGFNEGEILRSKYPVFLKKNDLYIWTSSSEIIKVDIVSGEIKKYVSEIMSNDFVDTIINSQFVMESVSTSLPRVNSTQFDKSLARYLKLKVSPEYSKRENGVLLYYDKISVLVDITGNGELIYHDEVSNLNLDKVEEFVNESNFETTKIPSGVEKWVHSGYVRLRKRNKKKSRADQNEKNRLEQLQYEIDIVSDSINGIYIPFDLDDCFKSLDVILSKRTINEIRNVSSKAELSNFHFGVGRWLRNNWGLWRGSRLRTYLSTIGISHPDNMSGYIIDKYYEYLNNQN